MLQQSPLRCLQPFFKILLITVTVSIAGKTNAQSADEKAIRQLLAEQTKAWNAGDLDKFMEGYWHSDSLVFIGKNGPRYGYEQTLSNYKRNYPDTSAMGKLHFDLLQTKALSFQYYFVIGKWHLKRTVGNLDGSFTLLFRKIRNQWYIISDHSS